MSINNDPIAIEFPSEPSKNSQSLQTLTSGPLSSSLSSLFSAFQTLPSNQDFHFSKSFDDFNLPIDQIAKLSDSLLESIGSSATTWCLNKSITFPSNIDSIADKEAYDWLVNINNDMMKRFDVSIDEFQNTRKRQEETGRCIVSEPDINGLAYLKKKKKGDGGLTSNSVVESVSGKQGGSSSYTGVKVKKCTLPAEKKEKIPFHIPTIRKPQQEYKILVDNSNQPFEHVWLQKSEDGQRFVHPLENLSVMDFVDKDVADIEPVKPPPIESTPFMLVEEEKDLKELAAKLQSVNEFAVDLEHNQYRSFQGLTCLMQISTRTEDFIVDTLKLRSHVGPYLREVFKDPTKKKVLHGADRDIVWLQRDFGIYICNLFDTGQASRVLKMERNSLEHLLQHFCGVTANKQYQNADWRLRPLTAELLRYGREDTHYLLYIYDLMRVKLLSMPMEPEHCDTPLVEVYKRSYDVCMQLYEKELLTENSYLHIHGVQAAGFNANQLAIAAGLCEWRDPIARSEDESTGYILPNKVLLDIAKQMPLTSDKLRRLLKSKFPYVERNLGAVVSIIKRSIQKSAKFEEAAQQLKMARALHEERKLEQIRSSANLSSHPFSPPEEPSTVVATDFERSFDCAEEPTRVSQISPPEEPSTVVATDSDEDEPYGGGGGGSPETADADSPVCHISGKNKGNDEEIVPLSDLSTSFEQCTHSFKAEKSEGQSSPLQLKPFDYEAALRQVFPAPGNRTATKSKRQSSPLPLKPFDYEAAIRQVFPASVNNSATKSKGQSSPLQLKPKASDYEAASGNKSASKSKGQSSSLQLKPFDYEVALRQVFPRSGNRGATLR